MLGADGQWSAAAAVELHAALAAHLRCNAWRLAFSTLQHGARLSSLHRRAAAAMPGPAVLAVSTTTGRRLGAFCLASGRPHLAAGSYGSGECWLWSAAAPERAAGCS